jgi:DNA polymerase-1
MAKSGMTLLVDGDIIVYQMTSSVEVEIEWEPDLWTLHSDAGQAKAKVEDALDVLFKESGADKMVIALSDLGRNFRKDILPTYKDNRAGKRKPVAYRPVREFLHENYEVFERPGLEADDVLGILSTSKKLIQGDRAIWSIDKDMKTIPGTLYKGQGVYEDVFEADADYWHLIQTLTGDTADGYKGCPGVGPVKAEKFLKPFIGSVPDMWLQVEAAFVNAGLTREDALQQARVARILRASDYDFKAKEPILWEPL